MARYLKISTGYKILTSVSFTLMYHLPLHEKVNILCGFSLGAERGIIGGLGYNLTSASNTILLPSGQITWSTCDLTRSQVNSGVLKLAWNAQ